MVLGHSDIITPPLKQEGAANCLKVVGELGTELRVIMRPEYRISRPKIKELISIYRRSSIVHVIWVWIISDRMPCINSSHVAGELKEMK